MKKKTIIIILIIVGILLLLLIGGYIAINTMFSMFSDSFEQVPIEELGKKPAIELTTPSPESEGDGQTDAETASSPKPVQKGDGIVPEDLNLSEEKSKEMINSVPFSEKMSVLTILNKNLTANEYKELIGMLSGGITSDEIKRAKEVLRSSLSEEDKKTIKEYYNKYSGLLE